jgi:SRSO17 transposase
MLPACRTGGEPFAIPQFALTRSDKEGHPTTAVWLLIKRTLGAHPRYWYYLSNAPMSAPFRLFVWLSGVRWAIEQCFEETNAELGMDHYEVRKYPG